MPRKPDLPCADCGELMWRGKGVLPAGQARCRQCRSLDAKRHGYSRYRAGCRCGECREGNRARHEQYRRAFEERNGRGYYDGYDRKGRPRAGAKCLGCGESVRGSYQKDRPYHRACRLREERAERKRHAVAARLEKAAEGTRSEWVWVVGECAQCLQAFARHGQASRFCSTKCRQRARRSWKIAMRDRLAIYDRDGWTCRLCMEPVDRDLMTTDPMNDWAPSLDHIEPQSWALIPDHSPANLRLAHRWCNSVRGDLSHHTDADLRVA